MSAQRARAESAQLRCVSVHRNEMRAELSSGAKDAERSDTRSLKDPGEQVTPRSPSAEGGKWAHQRFLDLTPLHWRLGRPHLIIAVSVTEHGADSDADEADDGGVLI